MTARLRELYKKEIVPQMMQEFNYKNVMQTPRLEKIVVNMGVGEGQGEPRNLDAAMTELAAITGQKPNVRLAKRSISGFKVRKGARIACAVTLRGDRMYEFLDRLIHVAIPRIRDFRGLSPRSFDGRGNFTLGLREQTIFPEVDLDAVTRVRGMNVTFVINPAKSDEEGCALLRKFGMPFRN